VTLPGQLEKFGDEAVLAALECFESEGSLELAGKEAEIAEELLQCSLVRATIQARYILSDGEVRLRLHSNGLSVAGAWLKRVLAGEAGPEA
jgi:hypothetical protein